MRQPRIWILPQEVAERIAAGEVVERPASVVKELVENALDAGARRITVETEAGGKALVRVSDDGCGMTPEDTATAIQRHATSKLRTAEDLFNIRTLGFRGEALPSIAAVSELEIVTRTGESAEGARLRVLGGVLQEEEPAPAQVGTVISVRRLFYNVPVREKFLRSDTAEANQITDWLQRLALSRSDVSFRLLHDGREALLSPGSKEPLNVVVAVLGRAVARDLIRLPASESADPIRVSGFVSRPTLTRANRGLQHTYVNGRAVRSPLLFRALDDAYRSTMPQARYPAAVLFVEIAPVLVDVNVHPAKVEVRFQDEPSVHAAVVGAVRAALAAASADASLQLPEPEPYAARSPETVPQRIAEPGGPPTAETPLPFADRAIAGQSPQERWPAGASRWSRRPAPVSSPSTATPQHPNTPTPPHLHIPAIGELSLLGQAEDLFILAAGAGQLWVIDQHVAHERILFDQLLTTEGAAEPAEALLIPATVQASRPQALALDEHRALLEQMGFAVDPFGPRRYSLRSVPRSLVGANYEQAFRDLVEELAEQSQGGQVRLRREQLAAAAAGRSCKRAVKAGQKLSAPEMERLLEGLRSARNPYTCPHGRPVFITFAPDEIERLFGGRTCGA